MESSDGGVLTPSQGEPPLVHAARVETQTLHEYTIVTIVTIIVTWGKGLQLFHAWSVWERTPSGSQDKVETTRTGGQLPRGQLGLGRWSDAVPQIHWVVEENWLP